MATKVMVGMSGGVDSSVTALVLMEQGYEVEGLFMKNWDEDDGTEYCTAQEDLADAQLVADKLGIKLHTANFAAEYWDNVFEHFLAEYKSGRTPNPDILCNREIKFKVFTQYAKMLGAEYIATGHYVRKSVNEDGDTLLLKGLDANKDQSYFLHAVPGNELAKSLFPIGELEKTEVRAIAERAGLATARKKDSTGICFIGERRFADFLNTYIPHQPGRMVTPEGEDIGEHHGLMYYTYGQRQGLGIGGRKTASSEPWFVVGKDLEQNQLLVAQGVHPMLLNDTLSAETPDWVNPIDLSTPLKCMAKTRYRQADQACTLHQVGDELIVEFEEQQRAVTPGQSVVFYQDDVCLGGAIITRFWNRKTSL